MKRRMLSLLLTAVVACTLLPMASATEISIREAVPCQYDWVRDFSEGFAVVGVGDRIAMKYGIIDKTGKEIVPCVYDDIQSFSEGLARVGIGKNPNVMKYGFVDKTGKEVVPVQYDAAGDFSEGLADVLSDVNYGYIDKTGREVIPLGKYDGRGRFSDGLTMVRQNEKWGYIDKTGKLVIPYKYDLVWDFSDGMAMVTIGGDAYGLNGGKYGFIDKTGKEVVPIQYDWVEPFSEGMAAVRIGDNGTGKYGFIDKTGKEVVPCKYDRVGKFSGGMAMVLIGNYETGKYGFVDKTGKEVVPCKYSWVDSFSEGLAAVRVGKYPNSKGGFIDKTGKEVIPCKYRGVRNFSEGLAVVDQDGKRILIDKTGKEVASIPIQYDLVWDFSEGMAKVRQNDKWGYLAIDGYTDNSEQTNTPELPKIQFSDVLTNAYYADAVAWAVEKSITAGTTSTTFSPNDTCTQAQIVTFLWRANGSPVVEGTNPFGSVTKDSYFYDAVVWAYSKGIIDSSFVPQDPCTRASAVTYMYNNAGKPTVTVSGKFSDVTGASYVNAVQWALDNGVTAGTTESTFSPDNTCTRAQIVTFLYRAMV